MNTINNTAKFFDLHTRGVGYVNRIREIKVKGASPYLACTIAAIRGNTDAIEYTYFDCNVVGKEAIEVIRQFIKTDEKSKILVGFTIGDVMPVMFVYDKGSKQGQTGVSLKARLLRVAFVDVDGERVYDAPVTTALQSVPKQNEQQDVRDAANNDGSDGAGFGQLDAEEQMTYRFNVTPDNEFPKLAVG
jgi:Protein of unknown function (DUF3577)